MDTALCEHCGQPFTRSLSAPGGSQRRFCCRDWDELLGPHRDPADVYTGLTEGIGWQDARPRCQRPARPDGVLTMDLVRVYLTNAHRTSGGNGPGVVVIPLAEAQPLVRSRMAQILARLPRMRRPASPPRGRPWLTGRCRTEMSANPRILRSDAHLPDGRRVPKGTYLDVVPGSWLETALGGPGNLLAVPEAAAETAALGHAGLAN